MPAPDQPAPNAPEYRDAMKRYDKPGSGDLTLPEGVELPKMTDNHCRDCCCAQSWEALGVSEYDGKSIPEHIAELLAELLVTREMLRYCIERVALTPERWNGWTTGEVLADLRKRATDPGGEK